MSRFSKMVKEFIAGLTKENGFNYGMWYLIPRDTIILIRKLCEECEVFENAADSYAMENISLKRELGQIKEGHKIYIDFATSPLGTGAEMLKKYKVKLGKAGDGEKAYLLKINSALRDDKKMLIGLIKHLLEHNMYLYDTYVKGEE